MKCDIIAEGIKGTNVEQGKKILSGLKLITAEGLADAAQKVVHAAKDQI